MKTKNMTTLNLRNSINRSLWRGGFLLIPLALACFALLPSAQAVTPEVLPAPDGGYPGHNTAEGTNALFSRTTGSWDSAFGDSALFHDTSGTANTALGYNAMFHNLDGNGNTGNGTFTLFSNTSGDGNTALGNSALYKNLTGNSNTAMGANALHENTAGDFNIAIGQAALFSNTVDANVAVGYQALANNVTGINLNAVGFRALFSNNADPTITNSGSFNNAHGTSALASNTTGRQNNAFGDSALGSNVTGSFNTAIGDLAGRDILKNWNIDIGKDVFGDDDDAFVTRIGISENTDTLKQKKCFIGGIYGVTQAGQPYIVTIDEHGQLGTAPGLTSSARFKRDIKPMDKNSEDIFAFKPVTFHYKSDAKNTPQFGLVAEDVAQVNPDLIVRDDKGEIYSVRYEQVWNMMLNEFLKEHQTVKALKSTVEKQEALIAQQQQDFQATVAQQQKQIEALTAGLQKVSAQVETSRTAPQTVVDNH
jgi:hypothetical protein